MLNNKNNKIDIDLPRMTSELLDLHMTVYLGNGGEITYLPYIDENTGEIESTFGKWRKKTYLRVPTEDNNDEKEIRCGV